MMNWLLIALMGAVVVSLLMGLFYLIRGRGLEDAKKSNKMMMLRVGSQGAVLGVLALGYLFSQ